jgi:hypothetical protein
MSASPTAGERIELGTDEETVTVDVEGRSVTVVVYSHEQQGAHLLE